MDGINLLLISAVYAGLLAIIVRTFFLKRSRFSKLILVLALFFAASHITQLSIVSPAIAIGGFVLYSVIGTLGYFSYKKRVQGEK